MNAAFSEEDNKPSGSTCTDSIGEERGAVNLGDSSQGLAWGGLCGRFQNSKTCLA